MQVQELWRYPVKSMRGERLTQTDILTTGIRGDRNVVVVSRAGDRLITARTHPGLLGLQASVASNGETTIDGYPWHSAAALSLASKAAGEPVRLVEAGDDVARFDVLHLLLVPMELSRASNWMRGD
jgi:uncharacterized protein YcbX